MPSFYFGSLFLQIHCKIVYLPFIFGSIFTRNVLEVFILNNLRKNEVSDNFDSKHCPRRSFWTRHIRYVSLGAPLTKLPIFKQYQLDQQVIQSNLWPKIIFTHAEMIKITQKIALILTLVLICLTQLQEKRKLFPESTPC